jgi:hypothetical protein
MTTLVLAVTYGKAQFVFGWSGGYSPNHELNRMIYVYNEVNKHALSKEMAPIHWYQGMVIGFRSPEEGPYLELLYTRKRTKVESEWDSSGVAMTREIKALVNTWNFGIGYQSGGWRVGFSMDLGRYKGFGRRGPESGIGDQKWKRIWEVDNTRIYLFSVRLTCSETVYVERQIGGFVNVRLFAQLPGIGTELDVLDNWLFGSDLNFAMDQEQQIFNFGAAVTIAIGK